jgi:CubicO group peptidase (beta-lactamase class C family)
MPSAQQLLAGVLRCIEDGITQRLHIGAQLYVSRAGQVVVDTAVGEARAGLPLRPDSLMLWMSCSKFAVPIAILQQWERGRLSLDDRVAEHIPEFGCHGKAAITLRHVLTHTGGFRNVIHHWSTTPWDDIIAEICAVQIEDGWIPGRRAGYHVASAWYILAEVVRRLDGRSFSQYVRDEIFLPLGMHDSWIGMPAERHGAYADRIAPMHATEFEPIPHPYWPWAGSEDACGICRPGGSGWGPTRELAFVYEALLNGGSRNGARILAPQTVEAMTARHSVGMFDETFNVRLDRGLGLVIDSKHYGEGSDWYGTCCSRRTFGHGGYRSSVAFADPEHGVVVAVVFNGMPDDARHAARARLTVDAIYAGLGITP